METMARVRVFDESQIVIWAKSYNSLKSATDEFYTIVADTPPEHHVQYEAALVTSQWVCLSSVPGGFAFPA
jgi:hypothetical protein